MINISSSPLVYFELEVGKAKLYQRKKDQWALSYDGRGWMGYDVQKKWQSKEFELELYFGHGVCITTGLGLGIIQTLFCQSDKVSKIIVYEKHEEIIDIFYKIIEKNNFDISKLKIINQDADTLYGESCDCLFLDHFEGESELDIITRVGNIEKNNYTNLTWYWPAAWHYLIFVEKNRQEIDINSYNYWKKETMLKKLPDIEDFDIIDKLKDLRQMYVNEASGRSQSTLINFDQRNLLLNKFKQFKEKKNGQSKQE